MGRNELYSLTYKDFLFQPSKDAEAEAMKMTEKELKKSVNKDRDYWKSLEQGIFSSTKSYKLFRRSLLLEVKKKNDSCYVDVVPRRPCNKKDASGNRPESAHHTYVYHEYYPNAMRCTCEGFFYPHAPNPRFIAACPHILLNMRTQGKQVFDFEEHPEIIVDVLKLHHKHWVPYQEIDAYLFSKYSNRMISGPYLDGLKTNLIRVEHCNIEKPRNLEKLLEKD